MPEIETVTHPKLTGKG